MDQQRMPDSVSAAFLVGCLLALSASLPAAALHLYNRRRRILRDAANERWAQQIEDQSPEAILRIDEAGIVRSFNPAAERIFGYKASEIIGQSIAMILPAAGGRSGHGVNHLHTARRTADGVGLEVEGRRRDGTTVPIDLSLSESYEGARRIFRAVARDMTDRRRLDRVAGEARFSSEIIDVAGAAMMVVDGEGQIARVNRAWEMASGQPFSETQGRYFWEVLLDEREWPAAKAALARVLAEQRMERGVAEWRTPNGRRRISYTFTALAGGRGATQGAVLVGMEAIVEPESRQRPGGMEALERLAAGIAQRFNDFLTSINGYSDLLLHSIDDKHPLRRDVEEIRNAGERATRLTGQLLAFSQRQPMQTKPVHLNALIAGMKDSLGKIGSGIQVVTVLDPELGWIQADPGWIEQAILTLACHAADAMSAQPAPRKLTIATANLAMDQLAARRAGDLLPGEYVTMSVSDTGRGMSQRGLERVFEPFSTVAEISSTADLGLATVYGVVRQAGGGVAVESSPAKGATFHIYLPRAEATEPAAKNGKGLFLVRGAGK